MEKQLVFTTIADAANKQQETKKTKRANRKVAIKSHGNQNPWWKLTDEEKAIGKQGIAQIRAILDKNTDFEAVSYRKAS